MIGVFLLSGLFLLLIIIGLLLARIGAAPPVVQEVVMSVPVQESNDDNGVTTSLSDHGEEYELGYWCPDEPIQETTMNHVNSKIIYTLSPVSVSSNNN